MENLARYILRASFSQERMQYLAEPSKVVYRAKDGTEKKVLDAFDMKPHGKTGDSKSFDMQTISAITEEFHEVMTWHVTFNCLKKTPENGVLQIKFSRDFRKLFDCYYLRMLFLKYSMAE